MHELTEMMTKQSVQDTPKKQRSFPDTLELDVRLVPRFGPLLTLEEKDGKNTAATTKYHLTQGEPQ
jgi:hypothetical protein